MKAKKTAQKPELPLNAPARRCTHFFIGSRHFTHRIAANTVTLQFADQHTAQAFFDLLVEILPLLETVYPQINNKEVHLSDEQYLFYRRQVMHETGKLTTDYLEESLLKTLRADELDYSYAFILGIIPGANNTRRHQNLRPIARRQFTITPERTITSRAEKKSMYTQEQKKGFSQVQSCTLIDPYALSTAFGFNKSNRVNKLYGLMTHIDDALMNRLLIEDCGTVNRPFDCDTIEGAEIFLKYHLRPDTRSRCYSSAELREFKTANIKTRQTSQSTNEVLARLRFNPYRSVVCICADTLEARLLAHDFSCELLEHYALYAESIGQKLNTTYKIPIIFYIPNVPAEVNHKKKGSKPSQSNAKHVLKFYTEEMLKNDQAEASRIHEDTARRTRYYQNHNYEFLLGLPEITQELLFEKISDCSLALRMMKAGCTRMLLRLLRKTYGKPSLRDAALDTFTAPLSHSLTTNDPIIVKLILLEAFDLADKLLAATHSEKNKLDYPEGLPAFSGKLSDYIIRYGNPRQVNAMGLENRLIEAAQGGYWVTVMLCLKELPVNNILALAEIAQTQCKFYEAMLLPLMASQPLPPGYSNNLVAKAAEKKNWLVVYLIIRNPKFVVEKAILGFVMMQAINDKQDRLALLLLQAGAEPTWRLSSHGFCLRSSLYDAVANNFIELLPLLIRHENQCQDDYALYRYLLALDHAYETKNNEAITLLEENWDTAASITADNAPKSICIVALHALSINKRSIAEKRLLEYCHQFKLLPENSHDILEALKIMMPHFFNTINEIGSLNFDELIKYLVEIFLHREQPDLFIDIANSMGHQLKCYDFFTLDKIFRALAIHLTVNNVELINGIVKHIINHPEISQNKISYSNVKKKWDYALLGEFEKTLHDSVIDAERAFFLLTLLGFNFQETLCSATNTTLLFKGKKLLAYNIGSCQVNKQIKEAILSHLIKNIAYFDTFFPLVADSIREEHLKEFVLNNTYHEQAKLIRLMQLFDYSKYYDAESLWSEYAVLTYGAFRNEFKVEQQLIRILRPSAMKHITLMFVLLQFGLNVSITQDTKQRPNITKTLNFNWEFTNSRLYGNYTHAESSKGFNDMHINVLSILEGYFTLPCCQMPEEKVIHETFTKILDLFERAVGSHSFSLRFFEWKNPKEPEFNRRLFLYMQRINQELAKAANTLMHNAPAEHNEHDNDQTALVAI